MGIWRILSTPALKARRLFHRIHPGEKAFFIYRKSPDFIYETPGGVGTIIYFEKIRDFL